MPFNDYLIAVGFFVGLILFFKFPTLKKGSKTQKSKHKLSVIIPARNEETNLPNLLSDLKKQKGMIHEIICVDDCSEDQTPEIIKNFGVKGIKLDGLQAGWKGKTWACQMGAKRATGDVLLFIDADVRLSEDAIEALIEAYQETGQAQPLSVQPYHIVKKQHEYFSLFFNFIQVCATAMTCLGVKKSIGFYGPVLMISKQMFDEHGGYARVKNNVVEDFNLGRYYNQQGIYVNLMLGNKAVRFRMYPKTLSQVIEGWSKNFSTGSLSTKRGLLLMVIIWVAFLTALPIDIVQAGLDQADIQLGVLSGVYLISAFLLYRTARHVGSYPFYVCLFYPIYLGMFHIIFFYSIVATYVSKSTTWKGRKL